MNGIVYVAYGRRARIEVAESIRTLRHWNNFPITVICKAEMDGHHCILFDRPGPGARWAKLNIDKLVEYENVAYLDADTRVLDNLQPAFNILETGWDMLIALSFRQGHEVFGHVGKNERAATFAELQNPFPLQLQAGVMFFNRQRCAGFFAAWRDEWRRWEDKDQAAFIRALNREPIRIFLLGRDWNGGAIIQHLFGRARR